MKTLAKIGGIWLLGLCLQVCTTRPQKLENKTPFQNVQVKTDNFEILAEKGGTIVYPSGTKIKIEPQSLVDAEGNALKGKVNLAYREFHNLAEVMASGITMRYDSAGRAYNFETAGMFELKLSQNDKPVFLAKNQTAQVALASFEEGNYNFYYLNENPKLALQTAFITSAFAQDRLPGQNWQLLSVSNQPRQNDDKKSALDSLEKLLPEKPLAPVPFDEKAFTFDFELDIKDFPELKAFEGIIWQYAGEADNQAINPEKNQWIFDEKWSDIRISASEGTSLQYKLNLKNDTKSFTSLVRPALRGQNLAREQARYAEKLKEYEKIRQTEADKITAIENRRNMLQKTANFIRSFQIGKFGIYNCDRIFNAPGAMMVKTQIKLQGNQDLPAEARVYMITGRVVIDCSDYKNTPTEMYLSKSLITKLVAILPGDRLAIFSSSDFKKLDLPSLSKQGNYTFQLKTIEQKINSVNGLQAFIDSI